MEKTQTYHDQVTIEQTQKLREVLKTLPPFTRDYFRAMEPTTSARTRISYAYDIRVFFHFLLSENPAFKDKTMDDFTVDVLDQLQAVDIEEFQEYLKVYDSAEDNRLQTNGERGLKRKCLLFEAFITIITNVK